MKIKAIRGENIASFSGGFALELDQGILEKARVFCITGPTGSGKSSILDAMGLALFGQIHRYQCSLAGREGKSKLQGEEELTLDDPRQIVHKGAAHASAEVEFVGKDGETYCAVWAVRRSATTQRLGKCTHTLVHLKTGKASEAHTVTGIRKAIEEQLGMGYEPFMRTVLLAQGDMTTFLHATANVRSELLEVFTGGAIYSKLSQRAYEKAKQFEDKKKQLEQMKLRLLQEQQEVEEEKRRWSDLQLKVDHDRLVALRSEKLLRDRLLQEVQNQESQKERHVFQIKDLEKRLLVAQTNHGRYLQQLVVRLQPHLHVGDACLVCGQTVFQLPQALNQENVAWEPSENPDHIQGQLSQLNAEQQRLIKALERLKQELLNIRLDESELVSLEEASKQLELKKHWIQKETLRMQQSIDALEHDIASIQSEVIRWSRMRGLMGSHDGKKFRVYAQAFALEQLVLLCNETLIRVLPRYRLKRQEGLTLVVEDAVLGHKQRPVQSLSGGEQFIVALALGLALGSFASSARNGEGDQIKGGIENLFIDEGFGTLDQANLELVLDALEALASTHQGQYKIGIISHIPAVAERFHARVRVVARGQNGSVLEYMHQR